MKNIVQIRQITIINFLSIMRNNIIKAIAGIVVTALILIPIVSFIAVVILVESKLIHALVFLVICLYFCYMYKFSTKKENQYQYTGPYIIARRSFSGNLVFFEMLNDGTCGYYYKWYENCRGFRSDFYELTTKAPEDIQEEIIKSPSYPQSRKVTEFVKILVTEYLEKNK